MKFCQTNSIIYLEKSKYNYKATQHFDDLISLEEDKPTNSVFLVEITEVLKRIWRWHYARGERDLFRLVEQQLW